MNQTIRVFNHEIKFSWLSAGLIMLMAILTFGISVGNLGFYGDQWDLLLRPSQQPGGFILGVFFQKLLITVLGTNATLYHLLNVMLICLDAFWFLRVLHRLGFGLRLALASALLFMVFPGFGQPGAAFQLSTNLIGLWFVLLSADIYLSGLQKTAVDDRRTLIRGAGFACLALLTTPEVVVFEGLFLFILFLRMSLPLKKANSLVLSAGIAHGIIPLITLFATNPDVQLPDRALLSQVLKSWMGSFVLSWRQIFALPVGGGQIAVYLLILAAGAVFLVSVMTGTGNTDRTTAQKDHIFSTIWLLGTGFFVGIGFFLILNLFKRSIGADFPLDHGMVVIGTAAAIAVTAMVEILFLERYQAVVLAALIVLAAGTRYQITREFVNETERVDDFLAQLWVRGDRVKPGTDLLVEQLPFDFTSRNSLEAVINAHLEYKADDDLVRVIPADDSRVREFLSDSSQRTTKVRIDNNDVEISKDKMLGLWIPPGACVEVIDADTNVDKIPEGLSLAGSFSNPEFMEIANLSDVKQLNRFRTTIKNDWCYFFQLASRLDFQSEWDAVNQIYITAEEAQLASDRVEEFFPLLTSLIHLDRMTDAVELSKKLNKDPDKQNSICKKWTQILSDNSMSEEVVQQAATAQQLAGCE